ncbi:MAG: universal stress protein [Rhodobacteraceae bacterium]|nr:universal stress protein [Paracoccaceae bacterium]
MFDKVLLPIDLNHPASWEKALPMALKLAGEGGELHVLGIVHDLGSALVASYLPADFETHALEQMKADLNAFIAKEVPAGVKATAHVGHGHVPDVILSQAESLGADVVVMASHPPGQLSTLLVGSNADRVVHHATLPVLVVR